MSGSSGWALHARFTAKVPRNYEITFSFARFIDRAGLPTVRGFRRIRTRYKQQGTRGFGNHLVQNSPAQLSAVFPIREVIPTSRDRYRYARIIIVIPTNYRSTKIFARRTLHAIPCVLNSSQYDVLFRRMIYENYESSVDDAIEDFSVHKVRLSRMRTRLTNQEEQTDLCKTKTLFSSAESVHGEATSDIVR